MQMLNTRNKEADNSQQNNQQKILKAENIQNIKLLNHKIF